METTPYIPPLVIMRRFVTRGGWHTRAVVLAWPKCGDPPGYGSVYNAVGSPLRVAAKRLRAMRVACCAQILRIFRRMAVTASGGMPSRTNELTADWCTVPHVPTTRNKGPVSLIGRRLGDMGPRFRLRLLMPNGKGGWLRRVKSHMTESKALKAAQPSSSLTLTGAGRRTAPPPTHPPGWRWAHGVFTHPPTWMALDARCLYPPTHLAGAGLALQPTHPPSLKTSCFIFQGGGERTMAGVCSSKLPESSSFVTT